jgi:hypothetical protein
MKPLTPRRVARLLIFNWILMGGIRPWLMSDEEMNAITEEFGYTVTEKRQRQIKDQLNRIIDPVLQKCKEDLAAAGLDT